jgi:heat shock protein HtpX
MPPMLLLFLASGAATTTAMRLARFARRGLKLSRDHIADGEAVRVTHFPDALISALRKVSGRGGFPRSERVEGLLFDGQADHEGGSHPTLQDRLAAISQLGGDLLGSGRMRRDTRSAQRRMPGRSAFDLRGATAAAAGQTISRPVGANRPLPPVEEPSLRMLLLFFTDRQRFWRWQAASIDAQEWREDDNRNIFGIKPKMVLPLVAVTVAMVALHWPRDGNLAKFGYAIGPGALVDMARQVNGGPFCIGPSYQEPGAKCGRPAKVDTKL